MTPPTLLRARAQAPLATVHRALTDADAMRVWLAEHADVDLARQRYVFWGRYTPDGVDPRQRLVHLDDTTIRFIWPLGGEDTTTEISLAEDGPDATLITLTQSHVPPWSVAVAETHVRGMLPTFWELSIANLVDYVEGRELTPKCDFTTLRMRGEVTIGAAPGEVYDSLIDPERYRRWFGANVDIEARVGGRFAMGSFDLDDEPAIIVELEPERKVVLEWPSLVATWELEGTDGGTRLTFVNSGFDEERPPYGGWLGWLGGVASLRRYHEVRHDIIWVDVRLPGLPDGMLATEP
ncbi:SRPBCC family protein [Jiangella sp. DSM 45060]|uniref:SRPBCC family protein n=1 Tax=Jiangella sp. DSM 45060 TaxID=1798224 RepID=UPI00087A0BE9|nr:SRPBCC family protein [Jiangella sp. DSM 45060]SDT71307.1 Uncharacterized conserved protein YndB, AHSA1/START domain [Jiangella sp. DSM 45060]